MPKRATATPEKLETARRMRLSRDSARMTNREIAKAMPVSDTTVHQWMTGAVTPRPHRMRRYAAVVGARVAFLLLQDDTLGRDVFDKLTRIGEALGVDRIDYLDALSIDELIAMVDDHELDRSRAARRERTKSAETAPTPPEP